MRQAGILAAAGIMALETMVDRLAEDHANARRLAEGLASLPGINVDPENVLTNIVIFELAPDALSPAELAAGLAMRGIRMGVIGGQRMRAVTHIGIDAAGIDTALSAVQEILQNSH
jgi:threonine aldolase